MIQVVSKVFDILELLSKDPEKVLTLSDIANNFNLNHGTCANILKTLVERNYVEKVAGKKGYKLGIMSFRLGGERDYNSSLINAAKPEMERLTKKFNENSLLTVLHGNQRVALLRINSHNQLQAITPTEKEAYSSSTGRLLIALLPPGELEDFIKKYGLPKNRVTGEATSRTEFFEEVERTRKDRFIMLLPEDGILGIAVPICRNEKVIASLSLYLPVIRSNKPLQKKILAELKISAQQISEVLSN